MEYGATGLATLIADNSGRIYARDLGGVGLVKYVSDLAGAGWVELRDVPDLDRPRSAMTRAGARPNRP